MKESIEFRENDWGQLSIKKTKAGYLLSLESTEEVVDVLLVSTDILKLKKFIKEYEKEKFILKDEVFFCE